MHMKPLLEWRANLVSPLSAYMLQSKPCQTCMTKTKGHACLLLKQKHDSMNEEIIFMNLCMNCVQLYYGLRYWKVQQITFGCNFKVILQTDHETGPSNEFPMSWSFLDFSEQKIIFEFIIEFPKMFERHTFISHYLFIYSYKFWP